MSTTNNMACALRNFRVDDRRMCYTRFIPKLYGWCLDLGFSPGKIMPSRAFCSDENQGFPIILIAKHFGAFPFNHGRVGGIVSIDRHGPHADHGKDLLLLQASHVGYEPQTRTFGRYQRLHTEPAAMTCSCGKIGHIVESYESEFSFARDSLQLLRLGRKLAVLIDNQFLNPDKKAGLFFDFSRLVANGDVSHPLAARATGNIFPAAAELVARLGEDQWPREGSQSIGNHLVADDFFFRRHWPEGELAQNQLERNLLGPMPTILTSRHPLLTAACANTVAEFDRTYRSLMQSPAMQGRNLLFVAGINIDISPNPGEDLPLTQFVPWAAFVQHQNGTRAVLEQEEVYARLCQAPADNPSQIDLDRAIAEAGKRTEVKLAF